MIPIRISLAALLIKPLNFSMKREEEQKVVINGRLGYMSAARVAAARYQKHGKGGKRIIKLRLVLFLRVIKIKWRSELGMILIKKRGVCGETSFGDIKHNMGYRVFRLRVLAKVHIEWVLVSIGHNLGKLSKLAA